MNKAILIGNLANDPEFQTLKSGIAYCTFRIAVQRRYANAEGKREADFLTVVCWRQLAETANKFLAKGRKCAVEGRIETRSYDAQDGTKRHVTEIIADNIEFLSQRSADPGPTPPPEQPRQMGFAEVDDAELPF